MKIAHCIHGLGIGGAQQIVRLIVRGRSPEFEHLVYSPSGGVFAEEIAAAGAGVRVIPRRIAKLDPLWALALCRAMRADRVELVHAHLFGDSLHGYLGARLAGGIPVLLTLHGLARAYTGLQRHGYRWLLARVAGVIACTEAAGRSFAEEIAPPGVRIENVANGIEPPPAREAARHPDWLDPRSPVPLIAGVGRFAEEKGFTYLIDAVAELAQRGLPVRLALIGDGPLRGALEEHACRRGVADSLIFPGFCADVRGLLPAFDALVVSSLHEALPVTVLEAMAAGRCIVATAVGGIVEAIRDGCEGVLVPPADVPALADALHRVLADPELRARLGRNAERRYREHYTAEAMVARYEEIYRRIAAQHGGQN